MPHIHPPLPNVFSGRLLSEGMPTVADNFAAARLIADMSVDDLGGMPITSPSEGANELIARQMAAEAEFALLRTDVQTASDWYTGAIARMMAVAGIMHPEIVSDEAAASLPCGLFADAQDARTALIAAIAITSQNNTVNENLAYGLEQYRALCSTGRFAPKRYGANGSAIEHNLARFNMMLDGCGNRLSTVHRVLTMKVRMSELKALASLHGIEVTAGKELSDEMVFGSMIFGPKIGNGFMQNLLGNLNDSITIDMWLMRTFGRYTGTLIRDEVRGDAFERLVRGLRRTERNASAVAAMKEAGVWRSISEIRDLDNVELLEHCRALKRHWEGLRRRYVEGRVGDTLQPRLRAGPRRSNQETSEFKAKLGWPGAVESITKSLGGTVDVPGSAGLRRWIRTVVRRALEMLDAAGYSMSAADLQAILWYPEKEIYGRLTGRPFERLNSSYDEIMAKVARKEGFGDDEIERALRSVGDDRGGRPGMGRGPVKGDPDAVEGVLLGFGSAVRTDEPEGFDDERDYAVAAGF
jgi:hypothetical protein